MSPSLAELLNYALTGKLCTCPNCNEDAIEERCPAYGGWFCREGTLGDCSTLKAWVKSEHALNPTGQR